MQSKLLVAVRIEDVTVIDRGEDRPDDEFRHEVRVEVDGITFSLNLHNANLLYVVWTCRRCGDIHDGAEVSDLASLGRALAFERRAICVRCEAICDEAAAYNGGAE